MPGPVGPARPGGSGGSAAGGFLPYGRQVLDDDDVAALVAVLQGDWLTQGPAVTAFEAALCELTGARHAVAVSSGTAALHVAAAAAGLGPGDVVVTSPLSFVASANAARFVGATPAFVDLDPATRNLDLGRLGEPGGVVAGRLRLGASDPAARGERQGPEAAGEDGLGDAVAVDALVAVHYAGLPVDLSVLGAPGGPPRPRVVIEDACHALGGATPAGPIGSCAHSDAVCLSFHPVKPVTTAEGGAVLTDDAVLADRARRLRSHAMRPTPELGGWAYDVDELGWNYRLSDLHAALGTSQLAKLGGFRARREELAGRYRERFAAWPEGLRARVGLPPDVPEVAGWRHGWHLFVVEVPARRVVYDALRAAGIGVQVHYRPIHLHSAYRELGFGPGDLPVAEEVGERVLSLPLFPSMLDTDVDRVVDTLAGVLGSVDGEGDADGDAGATVGGEEP